MADQGISKKKGGAVEFLGSEVCCFDAPSSPFLGVGGGGYFSVCNPLKSGQPFYVYINFSTMAMLV